MSINPSSFRTLERDSFGNDHSQKLIRQEQENITMGKTNKTAIALGKKKTSLNLRMTKIPVQADFQDEFMGKYDEFSQSWRD